MRYAAVGVPVATVWSSPTAPGGGDGSALSAEPDVPAWIAALGHEQRLSLVGRVVTQALWGDLVLVLQEQAGWARVLLPDQPTSLDARGYPGWIPSAQQYAPCGQALVDSAMSFTGLAYLWGGVSGFGFDCSGLAWGVLRRHGITAPRDAHDQAESGQPVSPGALEPGDLVFFAERPGGHVHHVGMALGDGRMVHAPRTGRPVEVTPLSAGPYARELVTARRYC